MKDYLQMALSRFNTDKPNWYGWETHDEKGVRIPNSERMQHKYIKVIRSGATIPSESDLNAKIQSLKDIDAAAPGHRTSGLAKLKALGLSDDELEQLFGK